jgi:hypothetical protein
MRTVICAVAVALVATGCGGSQNTPAAEPPVATAPAQPAANDPFPDDPQILARTTTAAQRRALERLAHDIAAMRSASARAPDDTLKGTPAARRTTSRFIVHLEQSTIDDLSKNRLIDHAAAAIASVCDQCFQQLEAMRPIPAIAH